MQKYDEVWNRILDEGKCPRCLSTAQGAQMVVDVAEEGAPVMTHVPVCLSCGTELIPKEESN